MPYNPKNQSYPPASVRTLQILDLFAEDHSPKTLKYISDKLDIPITSTYRIINCMIDYGYIIEAEIRNYYQLGYKIASFSDILFLEDALIKHSHAHMQEFTDKSSQACQLLVLHGSYSIILDQTLPAAGITVIGSLRENLPINVTAGGKLLTALMEEPNRTNFLQQAFPTFHKNTEYTIMNYDTYREELNRVAKQKYAPDIEEYAIGVGCLAVPLYLPGRNEPVAALTATGPLPYYTDAKSFDFMLNNLKRAAVQIEKHFV